MKNWRLLQYIGVIWTLQSIYITYITYFTWDWKFNSFHNPQKILIPYYTKYLFESNFSNIISRIEVFSGKIFWRNNETSNNKNLSNERYWTFLEWILLNQRFYYLDAWFNKVIFSMLQGGGSQFTYAMLVIFEVKKGKKFKSFL